MPEGNPIGFIVSAFCVSFKTTNVFGTSPNDHVLCCSIKPMKNHRNSSFSFHIICTYLNFVEYSSGRTSFPPINMYNTTVCQCIVRGLKYYDFMIPLLKRRKNCCASFLMQNRKRRRNRKKPDSCSYSTHSHLWWWLSKIIYIGIDHIC